MPIRRLSLLGLQSWEAGTANALRVRATIADKAGNQPEAEIVMPEGTAEAPDMAAIDPEIVVRTHRRADLLPQLQARRS